MIFPNAPVKPGSPLVGGGGFAFLRKSHAGCNMHPACCQEPAFESIAPILNLESKRKTEHLSILCLLVGGGGFEPPKSLTTDLQSAPFGHSGNLPYSLFKLWSWWTDLNPRPADYKSAALPTELHQRTASHSSAASLSDLFILTQFSFFVNTFFKINKETVCQIVSTDSFLIDYPFNPLD